MSSQKRKMAIGLATAAAALALVAPLLSIGASGATTNHARAISPDHEPAS